MPAVTADPASLADALERWAGDTLGPPVDDAVIAEVRDDLEGAARDAVAAAGDLPAGPIRLSKRRITDLLACERHLVLTADDAAGGGGSDDEALHLGVLIDVLAEHFVVSGQPTPAPEPLALGLELCEAHGDKEATVDWVGSLDGAARRAFSDRLTEKRDGLLRRWPAFDPVWWPRTQERAVVALADGDVVLDGRADVVVGGQPSGRPAVVVEVKSGSFSIEQRDDGLVYALLLALRDGRAPAAAVTATASGAVHVEVVTAGRLATAAVRVGEAIRAAGELAGGRQPVERAGFRCDRCPVRATCVTGQGWERPT